MAKATKNKKRTTNYNHKRHGLHQKRTNKFVKTYWPYIPLLVIVVIGLAINLIWTRYSSYQLSHSKSAFSNQQLLDASNQSRKNYGIKPLSLSSQLDLAATTKANDMVKNNYWSHISETGKTPWYFISQSGYKFQAAAENLAYGFSSGDQVSTAWLNSPEHRNNLMNQDYSDVGYGIASSKNFNGRGYQTIIVAIYAKPVTSNISYTNNQLINKNPGSINNSVIDLSSISKNVSANIASSQNISRIQILTTGYAPWGLFVGSILAGLFALYYIHKHIKSWHKFIVKGEEFVVHHSMLDTVAISLIMVDLILSHGSGTIL